MVRKGDEFSRRRKLGKKRKRSKKKNLKRRNLEREILELLVKVTTRRELEKKKVRERR